MARIGKRLKAAHSAITDRSLDPGAAVAAVKGVATAKFDETIEVAVRLGVDPRHADQTVRGVCKLPHGTGRTLRIAVFARGDLAEQARAAGADVVGAEDLLESMQGGEIGYDRVIASPDMMGLVGRLGKILGPRGLMPNPKVGTVSADPGAAVTDALGGAVEFRAEKAGIVHGGIGKASFSVEALEENMKAFVGALIEARPSGAKGTYVRGISLSSTMGPSVRVDVQAALAMTG